jgi:hypothetical protein
VCGHSESERGFDETARTDANAFSRTSLIAPKDLESSPLAVGAVWSSPAAGGSVIAAYVQRYNFDRTTASCAYVPWPDGSVLRAPSLKASGFRFFCSRRLKFCFPSSRLSQVRLRLLPCFPFRCFETSHPLPTHSLFLVLTAFPVILFRSDDALESVNTVVA